MTPLEFVEEFFLCRVSGLPPPTPEPGDEEIIKIVKVVTTGSYLNVRSGPGSGYEDLGELYNSSKVPIVEIVNNWGRIGQGWISLQYTTDA